MAIASEAIKSKGKDIKIRKTKTSSPTNFTDIENLKKYAESKGLEVKEKKPSIFVRAMDIISRPLYASAGAAKAIVKGNENVLGEAWKGLKGEEKETYSDVLKEAGIDNKIARGVVGFALDVVLDPTTYFGGTLVKGTLRGSKAVGRGGFQIIKKVSPKLAERIEVAGQGIKDALGEGFNKAYGLKKTEEGFTLADDVNRYWNKLGIATDETIEKYNEAFKTLPKEQHKEFAQTLLKFRKQLPKIEKGIKKVGGAKGFERKLAKEQLNKLTPEEARKYNTAEEFVKGNDLGTAGMKFHITDNPNFKIDPNIIPSDLPAGKATGRVLNELELEKQLQNDAKIFRERGIKTESEIKKYFEVQKDIYKKTGGGGGLMVTRGLEPWLEKNVLSGNRKYVAIIDTTDVPLKDMTRSTRGFGDEIFINNPQNAKVVKVISIEEALKLQEANKFTKSQLTDIWNEANKAIDTTDPRNFGSAEEFVKAIKSEADNYGIKLNVLNRKPLKKEMLAGKYRNNEITIFTKDYNGNPKSVKALEDTFNHEVGHFFDHKRRGIVANPMGDSIRGYDGKLRPMMDSDIYFRNGPKVNEAQKIRELYPRKDGYSSTQKEIYADAFKLYKKDKTKLKEIAPNIYKEISDFAEADEMFKTKSQLTDIWNKENKKKFFNSRKLAKEQLNKLTPEFKTAEQAKFFKEKYIKIIDELAESAKLPEKERFKAYFPSIDIERLKPTTAGRAVSITDESYKKLYKGLIEKELDKPIEALSRTSMKILRDNTAREVLNDAVNTYGKKLIDFKTEADAAKAGYKLIKDKTFGKAIGYLPEREFKYIDNYLFPELGVIDKMAKSLGYDAFSRLFKTAVTSYFPAFHIRNGISGGIQNYQVFGARALHPDNLPIIGRNGLAIMKGSDKEIKLGNRIFNTAELRKELQENFGKTSRYIADLGEYIDELTDGSMKVISKINPKKLGDFIEMNQKANAMAIGLSQGKTIKEAIKLAETAGFNYQNITKFEAKVMRRIIPFYSFMRKNAELQAKTLISHPERILNQAKVANAFSGIFGEKVTEEDLKGVPPWALDGLGFKIKDNKYVASFGVPMEEFFNRVNNPLMSTLSSLNPLIKYPLESKMGYDFFRERKIIDLNTISPVTGKLLFDAKQKGIMPEWLEQSINIKKSIDLNGKNKYTMSPEKLHLLRNLPTSRFQNTFEKLLSKDLKGAEKMTALFTGGKIYDIDIEKQKYFTERDMRRDLEDWMLSIGEGKRMEKFYIPKEKKEDK